MKNDNIIRTKPFEFQWDIIANDMVKHLDGLSVDMAEYILSLVYRKIREKAKVNLSLEDYKPKGRRAHEKI